MSEVKAEFKVPMWMKWGSRLLLAFGSAIGSVFMAGWYMSPRVDAYVNNRIENFVRGPRAVRDGQITAIHQRLDVQQTHFDARLNSVDNKLDILIERVK
jgi:hypothetical protein